MIYSSISRVTMVAIPPRPWAELARWPNFFEMSEGCFLEFVCVKVCGFFTMK